jgi:O-methyltransferase domain
MAKSTSFSDVNAAFGLLSHLYLTPVLVSLIRGGVPDHLDKGPLAVSELAKRAGLDELSLTRALRALTGFGAFEEVSPGEFANNAVSNLFRNRPGGLRNAALFWGSEHLLQSAAALGHSVMTGEASFVHVFGETFWDRMRRLPEEHELFNRALADLRSDEHQQIADAYDWTGVNTAVDVGGGAGSLLAAILEKRQDKRGVLVEQPEVLPDAERLLSERGVRNRCEFLGGSFFNPISTKGEVWTMCQVLHDWPDADCRAILQRCREAMRGTDRLLVIEMLTVPCEPNPRVSILDMMMLLYFGEARQRTVDEYKELFGTTGFEFTRVLPTVSAFSIVEARPV